MENHCIEMNHLIEECKTVEENCLYSAQAHFILADAKERKARRLIVIPALIAAVFGVLTAFGLPGWLGAFSAMGGFLASIAGILGVDREPIRHRNAARQWTALRHEARSLSETYSKELTREQLFMEVRRIDDRYNALNLALEVTDGRSFETAREQIRSGMHRPDFRNQR